MEGEIENAAIDIQVMSPSVSLIFHSSFLLSYLTCLQILYNYKTVKS